MRKKAGHISRKTPENTAKNRHFFKKMSVFEMVNAGKTVIMQQNVGKNMSILPFQRIKKHNKKRKKHIYS